MMKRLLILMVMSLALFSVLVSAVNIDLGVQWRTANVLPGQVTALVKGDPDGDGQQNFFAAVLSGNIVNIFGFEFTMNDLPVSVWKSAPIVMDGGIKAMIIGDYDGDGSKELTAVGNHQNDLNVYVYEHNGPIGVDSYNSVSPFQSTQYPNTVPSGGSPVGVEITDVNHNGLKELMIATNLVAGGAIGVYESAPGGSNIVTPIPQGVQPVLQTMQAFAAGDADGNFNGVPDQAVYTYAAPPSPTPGTLTVFNVDWPAVGPATTTPINAGTGSGTEIAVYDADGRTGKEIVVANRANKNTFLSFIKYIGRTYSVAGTYQLPIRFMSVTSIKVQGLGASSFQTSNQPIALGLSGAGGFLVTTYGELSSNVAPYIVAPPGYPTVNAIPNDDADNDGLKDFLVAAGNEVLFYEDKTLVYLAATSNPRPGGALRFTVKNTISNGQGLCFLAFAIVANCVRYVGVEGSNCLSQDVLFHWSIARDPPTTFQNFLFNTDSRGNSIGNIVFNIPAFQVPPSAPGQISVHMQCVTMQGQQGRITNVQEAVVNTR